MAIMGMKELVETRMDLLYLWVQIYMLYIYIYIWADDQYRNSTDHMTVT